MIAFRLGIPYGAPYGHRGAFHSIAFAAIVGLGLAVAATARRVPPLLLALVGTVVMASHGLLDTLTDGGKGIALLWPFTNERFFAPWRPIPVAPIGSRILSGAGLKLMAWEALYATAQSPIMSRNGPAPMSDVPPSTSNVDPVT